MTRLSGAGSLTPMRTIACGALLVVAACASGSKPGKLSKEAAQKKTDEPAPIDMSLRPKIKAHRGASISAPENTLASVRMAFDEGADACEIDVRLSKDGVVVVFHDEDTKRIGGRDKLIVQQSLHELRELDIGAWKSAAYQDERIATLSEILSIIPAGKTLFVEIKDGVWAVPAVLAAIENTPTEGQVAIESFAPEVLEAIAKANSSLPLHLTLGVQKDRAGQAKLFAPPLAADAKAAGFDGLAVDVQGMSLAFAEAVRAQGLELAVWTVNDKALWLQLKDMPMTWLETDAPALMAGALVDN